MKVYKKFMVLLLLTAIFPAAFGSEPVDQRGFPRDSKPDIGAYEFTKVETIVLTANVSNVPNGGLVNFTVSVTPENTDPTSFTFNQTSGLLSFVSNTTNVFTWKAHTEGSVSITTHSVDNPSVVSNPVALNVVAGSGLDMVEKKPFTIYPNPASDMLYFSETIRGNLTIVNMTGISYVFKIDNNQINISGLPEGIYTVYGYSGNELLKSKLVVKR